MNETIFHSKHDYRITFPDPNESDLIIIHEEVFIEQPERRRGWYLPMTFRSGDRAIQCAIPDSEYAHMASTLLDWKPNRIRAIDPYLMIYSVDLLWSYGADILAVSNTPYALAFAMYPYNFQLLCEGMDTMLGTERFRGWPQPTKKEG